MKIQLLIFVKVVSAAALDSLTWDATFDFHSFLESILIDKFDDVLANDFNLTHECVHMWRLLRHDLLQISNFETNWSRKS